MTRYGPRFHIHNVIISLHVVIVAPQAKRPPTFRFSRDTGAKLSVESSIDGLPLKEFFLVLSSTGTAFRRCELAWVNGDNLGVFFKKVGEKKILKVNRRSWRLWRPAIAPD